MLRFLIVVCSFIASISVAAAQFNTWRVGKAEDLVSGKHRSVAQIQTTNVDQQSYQRYHGAMLTIFCDGGKTGARIKFLGKVSHSSTVTLRYKTDRHEQKDFKTNTSSDRRAVHLRSGPEAAEFAKHVSVSSQLLIHTDAPGTGMSRAVFQTNGASDAIAAALKDCR
jgi:hypothetical protein